MTGRFISSDRQLNDGLLGFNQFAYCENNTVRFTDHDGRDSDENCTWDPDDGANIDLDGVGKGATQPTKGNYSYNTIGGGAFSTKHSPSSAGKGMNNPNTKVAAQKGRAVHAQWNYGDDVLKEQHIAPGCRVDGIDMEKGIIYELKPNNSRAISRGYKQLDRYILAASQRFGGVWIGKLITYD